MVFSWIFQRTGFQRTGNPSIFIDGHHQWIPMDFHQWISMDFHQWIHWWSINAYGPLSLGPSLGSSVGFHWTAFGPPKPTNLQLWGPKAAQRKEPKKGPKERGPYSLMDHQWIHWWSINEWIHWWIIIGIHWCMSINEYQWISSSLKSSSLKKPWKNNEKPWKAMEKTKKFLWIPMNSYDIS